jgi:hypothetical protein
MLQIDELNITDNESGAIGYLPAGFENATLGFNTDTTIAGDTNIGCSHSYMMQVDQYASSKCRLRVTQQL